MSVRRIVANLETDDGAAAAALYKDIPALDVLMDHGSIATDGSSQTMTARVSLATAGGSGTPEPWLSVEVSAAIAVLLRESWGARTVYLREC